MSFAVSDYPTATQERHSRIHRISLDTQSCPNCDRTYFEAYKFSHCEQSGCDVVGCHECLHKCGLAPHGEAAFCDLHLNDVSGIAACLACEKADLDEEDRLKLALRRAA